MPKKLLMNNHSENGLIPIMDGLICWLDDRDECIGNKTVDRVGLNNFISEGNVTSDLFYLDRHNLVSENFFSLGRDFFIQLAINIKDIESYGLILSHFVSVNNFKICNRNNNKIGCYTIETGGVDNGLPIIIGDKQIITINVKNGIISIFNDVLLSSSIEPLNGVNSKFRIGGVTNETINKSRFILYSLKIYNRALTEEEIKRNYNYEKSIERG